MMPSRLVTVLVAGALAWTTPAVTQGYRARLDARFQGVSYRGYELDSIPISQAQVGADGEFFSNDGNLLNCSVGAEHCTYYRVGSTRRGQPLVGTVDADAWGFGISGLRLSTKFRVAADLADPDNWPGTDPTVQLLDGKLEYSRGPVLAQLGRTHVATRLGWTGFDGARAEVRPLGRKLRVFGYGGWGLARGVALPTTSSALNPLDEYQPRERQIIAGTGFGFSLSGAFGEAVWQREIDPESDNLVSDYLAFDLDFNLLRNLTLRGGAYYDLAAGLWGSADAQATYMLSRGLARITAGARRYRPRFPLWTIWGAFSPVAYNAGFGSLSISPLGGLELSTSGEIYEYEDAATSDRLGQVESAGRRFSLGAAYNGLRCWRFQGKYWFDEGPGSRSIGMDANATFSPTDDLHVTAHAEQLTRPLEFRFNEAAVWSYALRMDYETSQRIRLNGEVRRYEESRSEDGSASFDWDQWRINLGLSIAFGSGAGRVGLHPAILRIPVRRGTR